jgi:1-acyl-sn-glycerol-3-phosphate acyltransferase
MVKMLAIMVDRKNKESRERSVRFLVEELSKGHSIFLFPEGTRNRTLELLKEFKEGAFRMAVMAQVPIAVQTIVGAKKLNDPVRLQLYPGVVDVYWSDPIETKGMTLEDVPRLVQQVRSEMEKYLSAY